MVPRVIPQAMVAAAVAAAAEPEPLAVLAAMEPAPITNVITQVELAMEVNGALAEAVQQLVNTALIMVVLALLVSS